jgi:hypothetical protein
VPSGTYSAVAWFPYGKLSRQQVTIAPQKTTRLDFVLREASGAARDKNKHGKPYTRY